MKSCIHVPRSHCNMFQTKLFPECQQLAAPSTEGIKYIGSKLRVLPYIQRIIDQLNVQTIFDGFSGTTRISQSLAQLGYSVIANDLAIWSEVFATCYLINEKTSDEYRQLIDHLNSVEPEDGWFTENYGGFPNGGFSVQKDGLKKPWQIHNTRKLDGIRQEIDRLELKTVDKAVALTSLILALDKVDNSIGHYCSYLKHWSTRSYNSMFLTVPKLFYSNNSHKVYRKNTIDLSPHISADLAYYDPPYGSNNEKMPASRVRYSAYYHIWKSICLNDKPNLFGRAMRRADSSDRELFSEFEEFRKNPSGQYIAVESIHKLINSTNADWILLSYSSGGRATFEDLIEILKDNGKLLQVIEIDLAKNVMSNMRWTMEWINNANKKNTEYLFLLQK